MVTRHVASKGTLTPGEYCDRVIALRRALPDLEAAALEKVRNTHAEREARLVERVPEAERELAQALLAGAETLGGRTGEQVATAPEPESSADKEAEQEFWRSPAGVGSVEP